MERNLEERKEMESEVKTLNERQAEAEKDRGEEQREIESWRGKMEWYKNMERQGRKRS